MLWQKRKKHRESKKKNLTKIDLYHDIEDEKHKKMKSKHYLKNYQA